MRHWARIKQFFFSSIAVLACLAPTIRSKAEATAPLCDSYDTCTRIVQLQVYNRCVTEMTGTNRSDEFRITQRDLEPTASAFIKQLTDCQRNLDADGLQETAQLRVFAAQLKEKFERFVTASSNITPNTGCVRDATRRRSRHAKDDSRTLQDFLNKRRSYCGRTLRAERPACTAALHASATSSPRPEDGVTGSVSRPWIEQRDDYCHWLEARDIQYDSSCPAMQPPSVEGRDRDILTRAADTLERQGCYSYTTQIFRHVRALWYNLSTKMAVDPQTSDTVLLAQLGQKCRDVSGFVSNEEVSRSIEGLDEALAQNAERLQQIEQSMQMILQNTRGHRDAPTISCYLETLQAYIGDPHTPAPTNTEEGDNTCSDLQNCSRALQAEREDLQELQIQNQSLQSKFSQNETMLGSVLPSPAGAVTPTNSATKSTAEISQLVSRGGNTPSTAASGPTASAKNDPYYSANPAQQISTRQQIIEKTVIVSAQQPTNTTVVETPTLVLQKESGTLERTEENNSKPYIPAAAAPGASLAVAPNAAEAVVAELDAKKSDPVVSNKELALAGKNNPDPAPAAKVMASVAPGKSTSSNYELTSAKPASAPDLSSLDADLSVQDMLDKLLGDTANGRGTASRGPASFHTNHSRNTAASRSHEAQLGSVDIPLFERHNRQMKHQVDSGNLANAKKLL